MTFAWTTKEIARFHGRKKTPEAQRSRASSHRRSRCMPLCVCALCWTAESGIDVDVPWVYQNKQRRAAVVPKITVCKRRASPLSIFGTCLKDTSGALSEQSTASSVSKFKCSPKDVQLAALTHWSL